MTPVFALPRSLADSSCSSSSSSSSSPLSPRPLPLDPAITPGGNSSAAPNYASENEEYASTLATSGMDVPPTYVVTRSPILAQKFPYAWPVARIFTP